MVYDEYIYMYITASTIEKFRGRLARPATSPMLLAAMIACAALQGSSVLPLGRRSICAASAAMVWAPLIGCRADAEEAPVVLTDEEMAARVARKTELLRAQSRVGGSAALDSAIRSDVNPEAAINIRSRSVLENAKLALVKQEELKKRDKQQKRDDLCEMLGRGC